MKYRALGLFVCSFSLLCCGISEQAKQVRMYQDQLKTMLDKNEQEVNGQIIKGWRFELFHIWEANDPNVETVIKNNFRSYGFSKEEAHNIFASQGKYKVEIYLKLLGSEQLSTGEVSSIGSSILTAQDRYTSRDYAYIRVVFRDGKLVHVRLWS